MLIITRKMDQAVHLGDNITVEVLEIKGNQVRLGVTAPPEVLILREELLTTPKKISLCLLLKEVFNRAIVEVCGAVRSPFLLLPTIARC